MLIRQRFFCCQSLPCYMSSRAKKIIRSRMIFTAEGSAVETTNLLRLHHGEQVAESVHRPHKQQLSPCLAAQTWRNRRFHKTLQHQSSGALRNIPSNRKRNCAREANQVVDSGKTPGSDCNEESDLARSCRRLGREIRTADPSARRMSLATHPTLLGMTRSRVSRGTTSVSRSTDLTTSHQLRTLCNRPSRCRGQLRGLHLR